MTPPMWILTEEGKPTYLCIEEGHWEKRKLSIWQRLSGEFAQEWVPTGTLKVKIDEYVEAVQWR